MKDGVRGRALVEALVPEPDDYFVLKPKHSGFFSTTLDILLEYLGVKTVILTGVAGNICVLFTANDAYMRDFSLVVPRDCVASNTEEENRRTGANEKSPEGGYSPLDGAGSRLPGWRRDGGTQTAATAVATGHMRNESRPRCTSNRSSSLRPSMRMTTVIGMSSLLLVPHDAIMALRGLSDASRLEAIGRRPKGRRIRVHRCVNLP